MVPQRGKVSIDTRENFSTILPKKLGKALRPRVHPALWGNAAKPDFRQTALAK
jgi:hypothetical protein